MDGEVAHNQVMLLDTLLILDDFHVIDCSAETLAVEYVVQLRWVATWSVRDEVRVLLLEPSVANMEAIGYSKLQDSFTFCVVGTKAMASMGISVHTGSSTNVSIPITNWDEYLRGWDFGNSILQLVLETLFDRLR